MPTPSLSARGLSFLLVPALAIALTAAVRDAPAAAPTPPHVPAFPGAYGWGAYARGPRAGAHPVIAFVTNTRAAGAGSLKFALERPEPRFVLPRTAGTVTLDTTIEVKSDGFYHAGQVAPRGGLQVRRYWLRVNGAKDGIVRFWKGRVGSDPTWRRAGCNAGFPRKNRCGCTRAVDANRDGVFEDWSACNDVVLDGPFGRDGIAIVGPAERIVIDHASLQWHADEALDWNRGGESRCPTDLTVQYSILGPGNYSAALRGKPGDLPGHVDAFTSTGALTGSNGSGPQGQALDRTAPCDRYSFVRNLFAANLQRQPKFKGRSAEIVQNWIVGGQGVVTELEKEGAELTVDIVENHYAFGAKLEPANVDACHPAAACARDEGRRRCNAHPDSYVVLTDASMQRDRPPSIHLERNYFETKPGTHGRRQCSTCSARSANAGAPCLFNDNCPGGTCDHRTRQEAPGGRYARWDDPDDAEQWNGVMWNVTAAAAFPLRRAQRLPSRPRWMPPATDPVALPTLLTPELGATKPRRDALDDDTLAKIRSGADLPENPTGPFRGFAHPKLDADLAALPTQVCPIVTDGPGPFDEASVPRLPGTTAVGDVAYADSDCDGVPSDFEAKLGTDPRIFDSLDDADGDGYLNLEEWLSHAAGDTAS